MPTLQSILSELLIAEALPISIAKEYTSMQRNKSIQQRLNSIFAKLAKLPNATTSKRGDRVYIPFLPKGDMVAQESPVKKEVEIALQGTDYSLKDYGTGVVIDKFGREQKLGKVLTKIGKQSLVNKVNGDKTREGTKQSEFILVFSKHQYDIAGMSTGRGWTSCMNLYTGEFSKYVQYDVIQGSVICYLTRPEDKNLNNPTARILIKPYINIANKRDVVYYPEKRKMYGTAPQNFLPTVEEILNTVQPGKAGRFELTSKLYCDSPGHHSIEIKSTDFQAYLDGTAEPTTQKEIKNLLTYLGVGGFTINPDLSVDVRRNVDLRYSKLSVIPVKFRKVGGDFFCEGNKLTSFKNAPEEVGGDFRCDGNKITSANGAPKKVGGIFTAYFTPLSDFEKEWIKQNTDAKRFEFE